LRLVTFEVETGNPKLGAIINDRVMDLSEMSADSIFSEMASFLNHFETALASLRGLIAPGPGPKPSYRLSDVHLLAPIPRPGKIIAVGLNYMDHAIETKMEIPTSPVIFAKFSTSVTGPYDQIVMPEPDVQLDYEAELAVVIGRRGKSIARELAMEYVAGYMPLNDVSARKWQFADKQWVRGKSCDTFCPMGPWLTTSDEVPDPHNLHITTRVNGSTVQDSNTSNLIFKIPDLIHFISGAITLEPGDVIATGTPAGVGVFRQPPSFLNIGDVVEVEVEGLGRLKNSIR
jgi:2-keto-4-pentenoate hydratase/2-oxohepta-3-ene-1,7-dioic acid hydratase in catechol pathway